MARTLAKIGTLALGFGFAGSIGSAEGTYRGYGGHVNVPGHAARVAA